MNQRMQTTSQRYWQLTPKKDNNRANKVRDGQ